jgi:lipoprotein NlpD
MSNSITWPSRKLVAGTLISILVLAGCASPTPAPIRNATPGSATQTQTGASVGAPAGTAQYREHVVRPGDTLMGIGRLYGQNVNDLVRWNGLANPHQIQVGQRIVVSPPGAGGAVAVARPVEVTPITTPGQGVSVSPVKSEPIGGRQPYSDSAWAAARPGATLPPTTTPTTPPSTPPTAGTPQRSNWLWPANGKVLAGFNEASNKGLDIDGKPGDPVLASAAGKVVYSGSGLRGYGKLVIIKHDENYLTAYAHNRELLVKEGDTVTQGQRIAELGSTDADRPKLHFEIRRQGRPVDPMSYLPPR